MGKTYPEITSALAEFIERQHLFFVASAPLEAEGHVNLSPKGLDSFRILDPRQVAYLDLTGSGAETLAHLRQNGRLTLLFCAFEGPPKIVRLYGHGDALLPGTPGFDALIPRFSTLPGVRSIIRLDVERISDSCGYSIPRYQYQGERDQLLLWAENKGEDGLETYRETKNAHSIDGLPALAKDKP